MRSQPPLEQAFEVIREGISKKIQSKQKDLRRLREEIETRRSKEAEYAKEIAQMEAAMSVLAGEFGPKGRPPQGLNGISAHTLRSQTVGDSAYAIMKAGGGSAKVTAILEKLREVGKLKSYESGYSTIKKTLDRDKRVEKRAPGVYGLVPPTDWLEQPKFRLAQEDSGETG